MQNQLRLDSPDVTIRKKFTAIQIKTTHSDDEVKVKLSYGEITGPHYNRQSPEDEFPSEEEAMQYALNFNPYVTWMIVPIITFQIT